MPIPGKEKPYRGLDWCPLKAFKMTDFEVEVKREIVALYVKVPT